MKPNDQTKRFCISVALLLAVAGFAYGVDIRGRISRTDTRGSLRAEADAGAVVWLTPLSGETALTRNSPPSGRRVTLFQKNKRFDPHVLVVEVGSVVDFPNQDPFFHNVFSLFEGKRFDLGLYESGTTRSRRFDRPGISYLFCNIHPEMSAVIVVLDTPYYATSNRLGQVEIANVPEGVYTLHVWREGSSSESLKSLERAFPVSRDTASFGKLTIPDDVPLPMAHKNKYGRDYEVPTPPGQAYEHR